MAKLEFNKILLIAVGMVSLSVVVGLAMFSREVLRRSI